MAYGPWSTARVPLEPTLWPALFLGCSDRIPHDQLGMQQQRVDMDLIDLAGQCVVSTLAQFRTILSQRGQRRIGAAAERQVIDTDDAEFLWNLNSHLRTMDHYRVCQQVVAADDGGTALLDQAGQMLVDTVSGQVSMTRQGTIIIQPVFAKVAEEGKVTFLEDVGTQTSTQVTDGLVSTPTYTTLGLQWTEISKRTVGVRQVLNSLIHGSVKVIPSTKPPL